MLDSTAVHHSSRHPKVEGSNLATTAGIGRVKEAKEKKSLTMTNALAYNSTKLIMSATFLFIEKAHGIDVKNSVTARFS